jgi:hypothetical protein
MNIRCLQSNGHNIAVLESVELLITDAQSALDLLAMVRYEADASRLVLPQAAVAGDFFRLATGLAGEVLQKFTNYRMKIAIYGDFSGYKSEALQDFIYECNQGRDIFFTATEEAAVAKLSAV